MTDTPQGPTVEQVLQGMAAQMGKTPEVMELMAEIKPEMVLENARNQRFANEDSSIPEKYRALITIATVAGSGAPTCLKTQIGLALRKGASPTEVADTLVLARLALASTVLSNSLEGLRILAEAQREAAPESA
jgi:alkylhydroperoxidase/carboxymuconolactone decarboxylase family protein YurZ